MKIELEPVENSSLVKAAGYHPESRTLALLFHNGDKPPKLYHFANYPPEKWRAFQEAESKGAHYNKHIRGTHIGELQKP